MEVRSSISQRWAAKQLQQWRQEQQRNVDWYDRLIIDRQGPSIYDTPINADWSSSNNNSSGSISSNSNNSKTIQIANRSGRMIGSSIDRSQSHRSVRADQDSRRSPSEGNQITYNIQHYTTPYYCFCCYYYIVLCIILCCLSILKARSDPRGVLKKGRKLKI